MNPKPSTHQDSSPLSSPSLSSPPPGSSSFEVRPRNEVLIDATLALYAQAEPRPGLESRVAAKIAQAQRESEHPRSLASLLVWKRLSIGALATASACGIVVGTVQHSQRTLPPQFVRSTPAANGVSAAGTAHTPTRMIPVAPQIDPNAPRIPARQRAQITRTPNHHPNGVATPKSPYPPTQQAPEQQPQDQQQ